MSASVYDGLRYLYAEQLDNKRHTVTIAEVKPEEVTDLNGRKTMGFALGFEETKKLLVVTGATIRRQLRMACGTEDPAEMVGMKIILYPTPSKKAVTGQAIRIAEADKTATRQPPEPTPPNAPSDDNGELR